MYCHISLEKNYHKKPTRRYQGFFLDLPEVCNSLYPLDFSVHLMLSDVEGKPQSFSLYLLLQLPPLSVSVKT